MLGVASGFRAQGLRFRVVQEVQGLGFRVQGIGFRVVQEVQGLGF